MHMPVPANVAVLSGDTLYLGGVTPVDEAGQVVAKGDVTAQTHRIFDRLEAILARAGMTLANLVFVTVYVPSLSYYAEMNEAYARRMPQPFPARKLIVTQLTLEGMVVEMTGIASRQHKKVI